MSQDVTMPQMGESIAEGTVTQWLKKVGERVERDEPLFEISTDKVDAEIPSPAAGVLLEIKVQPGQTVPINTVVAVVGEAGEAAKAGGNGKPAAAPVETRDLVPKPTEKAAADTAAKTAAAKAPVSPEDEGHRPEPVKAPPPARASEPAAAESADERRKTKSSPVVRKIAAENQVDIAAIPGTGIGGRVTKDDIIGFLDRGKQPGAAPAPARAAGAPAPSGAAYDVKSPVPDAYRPHAMEGDRIEEMSTMRSKIAEHMVLSRRISAHVQTVWEADATQIVKLRNAHKDAWLSQHGVPLTFTAFIMKAAVDAVKQFPVVNSSLDGNRVLYHRSINLGIAVALDWGLIVPVIHGADELNLLGLQKRANDLAERARTKKLKPDEVQGGTFTITNPGVFGSLFGLPIINQPQVAIMGVGAIEKRPVVIDDAIAIRSRLYFSLSFDHRIVDGAVADQFMAQVKKNIEGFDEGAM